MLVRLETKEVSYPLTYNTIEYWHLLNSIFFFKKIGKVLFYQLSDVFYQLSDVLRKFQASSLNYLFHYKFSFEMIVGLKEYDHEGETKDLYI